MSIAWGWPLAFAGLAALLVPLLLHLDRRRSVQLLRFAALRWIAARARPRRTWRVVEWLLLALRLLLIAVLVAWLAQPWLRGAPHEPDRWIAVVPGAASIASDAAARVVWLAPGFPSVDEPAPTRGEASVSSLLRELDAQLSREDTLEVRVPEVLDGLDAVAIELSRDVAWTVAGDVSPPEDGVPAKRRLALRFASEADPMLRHVRAALRAWQTAPELATEVDEGSLDAAVPAGVDAVLRLGAAPGGEIAADGATPVNGAVAANRAKASDGSPADGTKASDGATEADGVTVADGAKASAGTTAVDGSTVADGATTAASAQANDAGTLPRIVALDAASLDPALIQSADFPRWLHRTLFGEPPPPDRAFAADVAPGATATPIDPPPQALRRSLAWLAAALFLLERVFANGRRLAVRS